jgi:hypothetical protein
MNLTGASLQTRASKSFNQTLFIAKNNIGTRL